MPNLLNYASQGQQVSPCETRPQKGSQKTSRYYANTGAKEGVKALLAAAKRAPRDPF